MRNLSRLYSGGVNVPKPVILRGHVLVMQFIGQDGWPAKRLKEVDLTEHEARRLYKDCCFTMRKMYHDCKLIHADLSEYNILYHGGKLVIIDVSQSVEHDHPQAFNFLRMDCTNVSSYFRKMSIPVLALRELFEFVIDASLEDVEAEFDSLLARREEMGEHGDGNEEAVEEAVFKQSFIAKRLDEIDDYEKDYQKAKTDGVLYTKVVGMKADMTGVVGAADVEDTKEESDCDEGGGNKCDKYVRRRDESPNTKRVRFPVAFSLPFSPPPPPRNAKPLSALKKPKNDKTKFRNTSRNGKKNSPNPIPNARFIYPPTSTPPSSSPHPPHPHLPPQPQQPTSQHYP